MHLIFTLMVTTVLADCPTCKREVEAKILDCDACYEKFLAAGNDPNGWDELMCGHLECTVCQEDLS